MHYPESVTSNEATRFSTWNSRILVEYVVISRAEAGLINVRGPFVGRFTQFCAAQALFRPSLSTPTGSGQSESRIILVGACQLQRYVALRCP